MALFQENFLRAVAKEETRYFNSISEEILTESKISTTRFDIFLSHSFLDKEIIKGIFITLSKRGYRVYVDWIVDPHLNRSDVDKKTADLIRKRMKQSKSLIYATSVNANVSKWMPWEIGFMDGYTPHRCAILPVSQVQKEDYKGKEYLSLYPYLKKDLTLWEWLKSSTRLYERSAYSTEVPRQINSIQNWINL